MINWLEWNFVSRSMVVLTDLTSGPTSGKKLRPVVLVWEFLSYETVEMRDWTVRATMSRIVSFDSDKRDCVDAVLEHIFVPYDNWQIGISQTDRNLQNAKIQLVNFRFRWVLENPKIGINFWMNYITLEVIQSSHHTQSTTLGPPELISDSCQTSSWS